MNSAFSFILFEIPPFLSLVYTLRHGVGFLAAGG